MSTINERLAELAAFGRHENGIDRPLASPQERAARERFAAWAGERNYPLTQDRVGNLFARREGTRQRARPILVGSHLDTVPTGGAYDGAYGVAAGICALELLDERSIATEHPIDAVAWAGEEGGRFPLGCLGSSVFTGAYDVERALALEDAEGITLGDALASPEAGLLQGIPMRDDSRVSAYLELHVEQGPVLEREGVSIGIVSAIAGQRRYRVVVEGASGHAGTVPMARRGDALCAAAELILAIERAALVAGETVATVGRLVVDPNGTNVIPASATFSIDIRSPHDDRIDAVEAAVREAASDAQTRRRVHTAIERLESRAPAPMDPKLRAIMHRAVAAMDRKALDVPSGAGHDAMCLSRIAPTAMLFVPSIGGRSHVAQEETSPEDLEAGVAALVASIVEVDKYVI
ncbi:MAG TPA: Zn-dependent hydrolase [Candidatus Tyrphobacter sp.]